MVASPCCLHRARALQNAPCARPAPRVGYDAVEVVRVRCCRSVFTVRVRCCDFVFSMFTNPWSADLEFNGVGISKRHCEISVEAEGVFLSPVGHSRTLVNGNQVLMPVVCLLSE